MINWGVVNHIICLVLEAFKWSAFLYRDRYWRSCVWSSGWHDRWRLSVKHQQYLYSQQCYISPQSCNPRKAMPAFLDTTVVALVTEVGDQVGHILVYVWHQCNLFFFTLKMSSVLGFLGPVYTECQSQRWDNSAIVLGILFSLKTMALPQNWATTHFWATPLFSMRTLSELSQCWTDAWCKRVLIRCTLRCSLS